jgi:hypothetical protein
MGLRQEVAPEEIAQTVQGLLPDRPRRLAMSRSGKEAVDGLGAWRATREIIAALSAKREMVDGLAL